jgi:hypothetical protein
MTKRNLFAFSLLVLAISASTDAMAGNASSGFYSQVASSARTPVQRFNATSDLYASKASSARTTAPLFLPRPRPRTPCPDPKRPC